LQLAQNPLPEIVPEAISIPTGTRAIAETKEKTQTKPQTVMARGIGGLLIDRAD